MSEETQVAPVETQDSGYTGTSDNGQSSQSTSQPNDANAFQADYTRKYQALAEERKAFEAEKAKYQTAPQSSYVPPINGGAQTYGYQQQQQVPQQSYGYTQQPQQDMSHQALVDQFGYEGAQAILAANAQSTQQLNLIRFENQYRLEELEAKRRFGEEGWNKNNYVDPQTGQMRNRIMDYRLSINPITGKSLTLDDAWRLANPIDPKQIEEEARQRAYAEIGKKDASTPTQPTQTATTSPSVARPKTVAEAFRMARG